MAANAKLTCALATNKGLFMLERAGSKLTRMHYSKEVTTAVAANALGEAIFGTLNGTVCKMSKRANVHDGAVTCLAAEAGKIYSSG
jgi:WD40 repeat protein